ncbi:hypothetical protein M9H77_34751 [Catharanthus roseus]|uniref:Uncharacterized protein n=1 Tax=Catharanthus roseus TaxID=4058 RepID=A0ACB9ZPK5_CATRO|nr:hypothetical protein M9H77_34751 [Catharanthus roseus]
MTHRNICLVANVPDNATCLVVTENLLAIAIVVFFFFFFLLLFNIVGYCCRGPIVENLRSLTKKETFDRSGKDVSVAIDQICKFMEPFIYNLHKPNVSQSRLERLIEQLDLALNQLCDIIEEPLRDHVVTVLLQASLDRLLRVLLDVGASRIFSPADAKLLENDPEVLKEFFISGVDGLPRGVHGSKSKLGVDVKTLLRVFCHRSDSESSQFLKKHYKIPKSTA